ncbi:Acyltransferase family protein [Pseudobutyrivibrio sp. YE44]|uniref:acyltransferase family protein n=1 Tax=Pseudobutyrivibrio sp. YE44 TaxID=1520802 RepID=UPI00088B52BD|nr:acyltransferase family protein [Pseudobutyrivibrio sp. YE44]SDB56278.1 Acyltransferase family protein [Pseudobutyrivibrio sp. YE44]
MNKRNETIDIARGIAIIVMIMGHVEIGIPQYDQLFSIWYHAWHMPIFFIVSGYFFNGRTKAAGEFISRKAKQILVPFFFWAFFNMLYELVSSGDWLMFRATLIHSLFEKPTDGVPGAGALWFLPAMFWLNVIYFLIVKLFDNRLVSYAVGFALGFLGMVAQARGVYLPFGIDGGLAGLPFIVTGDILRQVDVWGITALLGRKESQVHNGDKKCELENNSVVKSAGNANVMRLPWFILIPALILFNWLFLKNGLVNFRAGEYQNYALTFVNAVAGAILLLNISRLKLPHILSIIGRDSLIYLCFNQRAISLVKPVLSPICGASTIGCYTCFALTTIVVILVCYVLHQIFADNKFLCMAVGKQNP